MDSEGQLENWPRREEKTWLQDSSITTKLVAKEDKENSKQVSMNENAQSRAAKEKSFQCEVCNKIIPCDRLNEHNMSKKHKRNIVQMRIKKQHNYSVCSKGVFFYGGVADTITDQSILDFLSKYGQIAAFERSQNCILVQFTNKANAARMIQTKQLNLEGQKFIVIPRKMNDSSKKTQPKSIAGELNKFWNGNLKKYLTIEEQAEMILVALEMSKEEVQQRKEITNKMESWLSVSFPSCRLLPFGSSVSGLSAINSDLDLYFTVLNDDKKVDETDDFTAWKARCIGLLHQASLVIRAHPEVSEMVFVKSARIPVIKFVHMPTGLCCDITCENKFGLKNSQLFRSLISVDAELFKPFFFLLKLWAKSHGLIDCPTGGLSSYGLNLLVLFYLQQVKLLPPVEELQEDFPIELCRYWNTNFSEPKPLDAAIKRPTLLELLTGFFQFYQSLDTTENVISPFKGQLVPVDDFSTPLKLCKSMPRYTENLFARNLLPLKISQQFNIQEPFELNQNVSAGFIHAKRFKFLCQEAEQICQQMKPTSPIVPLFGDFTPAMSSSVKKKIESTASASSDNCAGLPNPSVVIVFQLRPNGPDVTRDLTDQAINAAGVFLGRLLNFSYGLTVTESESDEDEEPPEAKKFRRNDEEQQQSIEDMVMQWSRPYEISFPFEVFHPIRETVANEIRSRRIEGEFPKSLLDCERQITSILAIKQLDGCAPAFYTPGGVVIKCHLKYFSQENLVTLDFGE